jgi:hypothetical protein
MAEQNNKNQGPGQVRNQKQGGQGEGAQRGGNKPNVENDRAEGQQKDRDQNQSGQSGQKQGGQSGQNQADKQGQRR